MVRYVCLEIVFAPKTEITHKTHFISKTPENQQNSGIASTMESIHFKGVFRQIGILGEFLSI
jgi:hypothetical protein